MSLQGITASKFHICFKTINQCSIRSNTLKLQTPTNNFFIFIFYFYLFFESIKFLEAQWTIAGYRVSIEKCLLFFD